MKTLIVRLACGLALVLLMGMAASSRAGAEAGGAGWYGPYQDGCYYFWDTQQFTGYDCTQSSVYGWYGPYEDGCSYLWDGYQFISVDCSMSGMTVSTDGGQGILEGFTVSNYTPGTGVSIIGGQSLDIQGVPLTGNPVIDAINQSASAADISLWLRPTCVYVSGDTCYID
jgi:hypothetical protein